VIILGAMGAVLGTVLYDYLVSQFGHPYRYKIIFGMVATVLGIADVVFAVFVWTNNLGDGFRD